MMRNSSFPAALGVWGPSEQRRYVANVEPLPNLADVPTVTEESAKPDGRPWTDPERVRWSEQTRPVEFAPSHTQWRAWMLAYFEVPDLQMGVIEKIATYANVQAHNEAGVTLATWKLDGTDPTLHTLTHPILAGGTLSFRWRLTGSERTQGPPSSQVANVPSEYVPGNDLIRPWTTDVNGWNAPWGKRQQMIIDAQTRVRLWLEVIRSTPSIDSSFWRIAAVGRLGGYAQMRGPGKAALVDARVRS